MCSVDMLVVKTVLSTCELFLKHASNQWLHKFVGVEINESLCGLPAASQAFAQFSFFFYLFIEN